MNTDKKLAHFVLQTGQLPVLRDWYLKVLDAHVVYENQFLSLITFDEEHHRLGIAQLPQPAARTPMTVGLAHSAYTFPSLESLLTKYEDLKEADIRPHVPVQHGPTTSIYYRDPDGNMVELQIDNFTTSEAATEYLRGEEFHADPFGPSFDPACSQRYERAPRNPSCSLESGPGPVHSATSWSCCWPDPNCAQRHQDSSRSP